MLRIYMAKQEIEDLYESLGEIRNVDKFSRSCMYIQRKEMFQPDLYDVTAFRVLEVYDDKFPAARKLMDRVGTIAKNRGYIHTILKRRRRFAGESTHSALNALLQGSAADLIKKAMRDIWKSGVCDIIGPPTLTVHDELCWSIPKTPEAKQAIERVCDMMINAIPLRVPVLVDCECGPSWGDAE